MPHRLCLLFIVVAALWSDTATAQPPARGTAPSGRQIEAADGDTVVIDSHARVSVVRRHEAEVRVVVLPEHRAMLVIADWPSAPSSERGIERVWRFTDVNGQWPLDHRWQGRATVFEPESPRGGAGPMLAIETPAGRVEFHSGHRQASGADTATVITFNGMSGSGQLAASFDEAERQAMSGDFRPSFSISSMSAMGAGGVGFSSEMATAGALYGTASGRPPVVTRVPSNPRGPLPVTWVEPQWPAAALAAGVQGMAVVVEMAIALDGSVRDARVLRSVPGLDAAALAAARQWRFTPAGPEGRADPLMFTIAFPVPPR